LKLAQPKASLVILTYNNLELTRQCVDSILDKTIYPHYEIILVDNNSQDGTRKYLKNLAAENENIHVVLNEVNQGFARGNNQGASVATGEYLVILNNDVVVTRGWLTGLIRHLDDPQAGMVGPVTNSSGNETKIAVDYESLDEMESFAEKYTRDHQGKSFEIRMLALMCVAMRHSVYDEVGPLDERFGIGMFEDDDYALRIKQKEYKIICAEDVFIHHWGSASFSRLGTTQYMELFKENLEKLEEKWGIQWEPHVQRPEFASQQIRELIDGNIHFSTQTSNYLSIINENKQTIADLEANIETSQKSINYLNYQLKTIYESNGWQFLQWLMRVRRTIIPEGSQREHLLKQGIKSARERKVFTFSRSRSKETSPIERVFAIPEGSDLWFSNRYPWPLVSVILPVHNHADMLTGAALSVLNSTYPKFELIILDDGSTDDIEPVLSRLTCNPRVRVFRQPNQKLPRALTHAHRFAHGHFITWTSADNMMTPNTIEALVRSLVSNPDAVLVYADVSLVDDKGNPLDEGTYRPQNIDPSRQNVVRLHKDALPLGYEVDNYINACFLYRRHAAQAMEGRYSDDLRGLEDYDFWLRLQKIGPFQHIANEEPLYYYRVHDRTMSHELLSQELDPHLKRGRDLIDFETERRQYVSQRWTLAIDPSLPESDRQEINQAARQLPVNLDLGESGWKPEQKRLPIISAERDGSDPIFLLSQDNFWQLNWRSSQDDTLKSLDFWKGIEIPPLARKARELRRNPWEFPQAGDRPVIGCHLDLAAIPVDISVTRQVISNNTWAFFVFIDLPTLDNSSLGTALVEGLENAAYLGSREFGEIYHQYACFDVVWLPPFSGELPVHIYRSLLALSYAIGRPFIAPRYHDFIPAPYQAYYFPPDESLQFITNLDRSTIDLGLIDHYLEHWKPSGCLHQLIKHADGITQEMALTRPDFGIHPIPETDASPWSAIRVKADAPLKCALTVNTLDKGGLEEMVAQLALRLPKYNVEPFVLCAKSGGFVADRLRGEGVKVHIADDDPRVMQDILGKEKPDVINTQWASKRFLEVASESGVPIVETIQNAYVWLDQKGWFAEKERSRRFSHAISVSALVKRYYTKWNNTFSPEWITTIPNGIDVERLVLVDQNHARRELGLPEDSFIFISLASYDGRKNQIGLMTAFDELAVNHCNIYLYFAGNVLNKKYYSEADAYRDTLRTKNRIVFSEFRRDTGLLLSAANAFIVNSFFEGWSLAATEAVIAGLPLIHSECGSAHELVGENGERGLVVPNPASPPLDLTWDIVSKVIYQKRQRNIDALVQGMTRMIEERARWAASRQQIRDQSLQTFNFDNILQEYVKVFRQLTS
jgi:GT2 family glycosyltransferase/glycosyltransferase involved in cell wall biosynthesis